LGGVELLSPGEYGDIHSVVLRYCNLGKNTNCETKIVVPESRMSHNSMVNAGRFLIRWEYFRIKKVPELKRI
jgi:hypothetical protein